MANLSAAFLLPVYNSEDTISNSIKSILDQDYVFFKLIVVENGSTDRTREILKKFASMDNRVIVYTLKEASLTKALCYGINKIQEDLILRLDN